MTRLRPSVLLLLTLMASIRSGQAHSSFDLFSRSSDTCPSSYTRCGTTPNDFCCPSDSTCISLDQGSSSICCPAGEDCNYISPITCDIQQQNVTLYPESVIKTSRLDDSLPKCGDACCPFGYTCQNNTCSLNQKTSVTATKSVSSSSTNTATTSVFSSPTKTATATASVSISSTNTASSSTAATSSATPKATITPVPSPTPENSVNSTACTEISNACPSFPPGAIAAGFFPGAILGAVAALLISLCFRRARKEKDECDIQEGKSGPNWSQRSLSGSRLCISNPIPQDDTSYRTDFLRSPPRVKRSSTGGRSTRTMIYRTGSRVRSLFSGYPRGNPELDKDVPPVPMPIPMPPAPFTPPRQRQPSTESIKIYSPPESSFSQSRTFLEPEPYQGSAVRPDTTFSGLIRVVNPHDGKGNAPYPTHDDSRENPFRDPER
ncbi:uncharacterized protein N7479_007089 [Penicillium vulpinum]|uniref:Uncharacterized protein n=1 Tax=Penicillium vulpinum TaxID=29845 RepID=A0A1V6S2S2_9EURO|nr:uncharacterized protein N7479_007089 [Penicillium vulpinum]KAJ5959939.1 hypothetical protein N7479_007089 [Penicillium vulpinum]OQE08337.1 hypothetical protein PENVUL_c010G10001 [Penicillium vulpinum]